MVCRKFQSNSNHFLSDSSSKESLVTFLVNHWETVVLPAKLKLVVGYDTLCYELLYNNGLQVEAPIEELNCDHEEADTRMFLHAKHAANSSSQVVIKSQDTDVFVLALDVAQDIACLVLSTGRNDKARLIDINKAAGLLGRDLCCALVAAHAPSGCDSVSSFYGKGKKKMFDLVK